MVRYIKKNKFGFFFLTKPALYTFKVCCLLYGLSLEIEKLFSVNGMRVVGVSGLFLIARLCSRQMQMVVACVVLIILNTVTI
jgi:hypothetical protein